MAAALVLASALHAGPQSRADFNGDSFDDIVVRNSTTGTTFILPGQAAGGFGTSIPANYAATFTEAAHGDFNGDGFTDLLVRNPTNGTTFVLPGSATGFGTSINTDYAASFDQRRVGDFNGDGFDDLLVRNSSTGTTFVLPGALTPFGPAVSTNFAAAFTQLQVGDFNCDLKDDLLVRNPITGTTFVLPGAATPFGASISTNYAASFDQAAAGNYDGDGCVDLLVRNTSTGTTFVLPGAATPFGASVGTNYATAFNQGRPGDYNGDGATDLLVRNSVTGNTFTLPGAAPPFGASINNDFAATFSVQRPGDYDGDGFEDLMVRNPVNGKTFVFPGQASGVFGAAVNSDFAASFDVIFPEYEEAIDVDPAPPPPPPFRQVPGFNGAVLALAPAVDGSGDVYAGGEFTEYNGMPTFRIARLNSDGTLDTAFVTGAGFDSRVRALALASDGTGDVYVGGDFDTYKGASTKGMARLTSNGTRNTAFDVGTGFNNSVLALAPANDGTGNVYVGGSFFNYKGIFVPRIARLDSFGTRDTTFDTGSGPSAPSVTALLPASDGSGDVYIGGGFTSYDGTSTNGIARLNSNGTLDTGFATGTGFASQAGGFVRALIPTSDGTGDVYAGGTFTSYNGDSTTGIARLNSTGTLDNGFAVGSGFSNPSGLGRVYALAPAGDGSGDVYVGGSFSSYDGTGTSRIARLNSDGSLDTAFAIGTGFNSPVNALTPATAGYVYVGGDFISYDGVTVDFIALLAPNGTVL